MMDYKYARNIMQQELKNNLFGTEKKHAFEASIKTLKKCEKERKLTVRAQKARQAMLQTNGEDYQLMIVTEELSELIKEISKVYRNEHVRNNVIEEMADVLISMGYLKDILEISNDEMTRMVKRKLSRLEERL